MGWRIVKQPDGLLSRFSDIVDNFTHQNMNEEEALKVCIQEGLTPEQAKTKVQSGVDDLIPFTNIKGTGTTRYEDCIKTINIIHGIK